jgi:branched-chain amino acid transport system ATP-binding protein
MTAGPSPPAAPPALVADHLCRRFRGVTAVADVSLRVATGARFGIIGPNGAGKTTLFNLLSGELRPTTGSVALFGRDITRLRTYRRATLGLGRTFQITRIFSDLTVLENLTLALHGLSPSKFSLLRPWRSYRAMTAEAAELAASFGLAQRLAAPASDLSHGEVRELEVLLALALKPRVLLLDEPAAGLSPAERVDIQALLTSLPAELTLIMIEHDIDVLRGVVDSAAVLHLGSLVIQGTMRDIQNDERVRELYLGGAASRAPAIPPPGDTPLDASTPQAGPSEASPPEVGTAEAGPAEAGPPEVGTAEAGTAEASPPEVGTAEASPPEAAPPGGKP